MKSIIAYRLQIRKKRLYYGCCKNNRQGIAILIAFVINLL
ncbi:hypothetical protein SAMN05421545_2533 [Pontibacter lucknowensis]|uniref:Uncharacterized protein n=1 Tax=Pontibacter lucknowensis TaxID=1077936 RepID=A0A1N6YJL3_9BACT|nr:hypothetical protein SAMN05421545_2533 [Pontibacter lucknowensis]